MKYTFLLLSLLSIAPFSISAMQKQNQDSLDEIPQEEWEQAAEIREKNYQDHCAIKNKFLPEPFDQAMLIRNNWTQRDIEVSDCFVPSIPSRLANRYSDALNRIQHPLLYNLEFGYAKNYVYSAQSNDVTSQFLKRYCCTIIKRAHELRNQALPKNEVGPEIQQAFEEIISNAQARNYIANGRVNGPLITEEEWGKKIREVRAITNAEFDKLPPCIPCTPTVDPSQLRK